MEELFKKYLENRCSIEEVRLLLKEFGEDANEEKLKNLVREQLEAFEKTNTLSENELRDGLVDAYGNIQSQIFFERKSGTDGVVPFTKRIWVRIAAAAVLVGATAGGYVLFSKTDKSPQRVTSTTNDVGPGGNKALLTLADESTINLETAVTGNISKQGNAQISKLTDGQIAYRSLNEKHAGLVYNTVTTPRGGQYQVVLSDGSKVWLNSASSIRFPASFDENTRSVEITGEAYFEVARNASKPFKINVAGRKEVEVLGTHFNINGYGDENTVKTTLLEGNIKVTSLVTHKSQLIIAGQQAELTKEGQILVNTKPDLDQVMAWRNGYFNFNGADTYTVMRFISRWYDVDIVYEGEVPKREFGGEIQKNLHLSQVLKVLEQYNIHSRLEGRKLIVLP